jgi:hypothetical protein
MLIAGSVSTYMVLNAVVEVVAVVSCVAVVAVVLGMIVSPSGLDLLV